MITKKNRPMRAIFLRDHEISELRPTGLDPLTVGVRAAGRPTVRGWRFEAMSHHRGWWHWSV
jgi:hypothetical protein